MGKQKATITVWFREIFRTNRKLPLLVQFAFSDNTPICCDAEWLLPLSAISLLLVGAFIVVSKRDIYAVIRRYLLQATSLVNYKLEHVSSSCRTIEGLQKIFC